MSIGSSESAELKIFSLLKLHCSGNKAKSQKMAVKCSHIRHNCIPYSSTDEKKNPQNHLSQNRKKRVRGIKLA